MARSLTKKILSTKICFLADLGKTTKYYPLKILGYMVFSFPNSKLTIKSQALLILISDVPSLPFRLQEKHNREKLRDHLKLMVAIQEELKEVQKRVKEMQSKIKDAHLRQERLLGSSNRSVQSCMYM